MFVNRDRSCINHDTFFTPFTAVIVVGRDVRIERFTAQVLYRASYRVLGYSTDTGSIHWLQGGPRQRDIRLLIQVLVQ